MYSCFISIYTIVVVFRDKTGRIRKCLRGLECAGQKVACCVCWRMVWVGEAYSKHSGMSVFDDEVYIFTFSAICSIFGHITMTAPYPVRSVKLSMVKFG